MMHPTRRESLQIFILLFSSVPLVCGLIVGGMEGEAVELPCSYTVRSPRDITSMCWGRGSCPSSKCTDSLIITDGQKVTYRSSHRYQLFQDISRGKVSLTIVIAELKDAGTYCCRIEHAGWFNDEKINVELRMAKAITTTPPPRKTTKRPPPVKTTTRPPPTVRTTSPPPPPVQTTTPPAQPASTTTLPPSSVSTTTSPPSTTQTTSLTTPPGKTTIPTAQPTQLSVTPNYDTEFKADNHYKTAPDMIFVNTELAVAVSSFGPRTTGLTIDYHSEKDHGHESLPEPADATSLEHLISHQSDHESLPEPDTTSLEHLTSQESDNGVFGHSEEDHKTEVKKERSISFHIVIIAISFLLVLIILVPLLIVKFKGKMRGQHLSGLDPNLELVAHAEQPLSEDLGMDRAGVDEDEATKVEDISINTTKD